MILGVCERDYATTVEKPSESNSSSEHNGENLRDEEPETPMLKGADPVIAGKPKNLPLVSIGRKQFSCAIRIQVIGKLITVMVNKVNDSSCEVIVNESDKSTLPAGTTWDDVFLALQIVWTKFLTDLDKPIVRPNQKKPDILPENPTVLLKKYIKILLNRADEGRLDSIDDFLCLGGRICSARMTREEIIIGTHKENDDGKNKRDGLALRINREAPHSVILSIGGKPLDEIDDANASLLNAVIKALIEEMNSLSDLRTHTMPASEESEKNTRGGVDSAKRSTRDAVGRVIRPLSPEAPEDRNSVYAVTLTQEESKALRLERGANRVVVNDLICAPGKTYWDTVHVNFSVDVSGAVTATVPICPPGFTRRQAIAALIDKKTKPRR